MAKAFEFADFVQEFWVDFVVFENAKGDYNDNGEWVEGIGEPRNTGGICLPLSNDDLKREGNGTYTTKDRKIYTLEPMKLGNKMEYNGQSYTIDSYKDYEAYADVYIYFCKGIE